MRQFQALDTEGTLAVKQELIESYLSEERSILQEMGGLHSTEAGYVTLESWMAFLSSTLAPLALALSLALTNSLASSLAAIAALALFISLTASHPVHTLCQQLMKRSKP